MIKVNLNRNLSAPSSAKMPGDTEVGAVSFQMEEVQAPPKGQTLLKLLTFLLVPGLIVYYDYMKTQQKKVRLTQIQGQIMEADSKIAAQKDAVASVKKYKESKDQLEAQLNVIRELSRQRLAYVKMLDALQDLVPKKAWLENLKADAKVISISGFAIEDDGVTQMIQGLEESVFFTNVLLQSTVRQDDREGQYKQFSINAQMGNP